MIRVPYLHDDHRALMPFFEKLITELRRLSTENEELKMKLKMLDLEVQKSIKLKIRKGAISGSHKQ